IHQAIQMPKEEQIRRNTLMQKRLKRYNVEKWAKDFMKALERTREIKPAFKALRITDDIEEKIITRFNNSKNRILFLDYDGTLVDFVDKPDQARPDTELKDLVSKLNNLKHTKVVLISGRDKET